MSDEDKQRLKEFVTVSSCLVLFAWFVCFVINRFFYAIDQTPRYNLYRYILDWLKLQSFEVSFSIIAFIFFWLGWISLAIYTWIFKK